MSRGLQRLKQRDNNENTIQMVTNWKPGVKIAPGRPKKKRVVNEKDSERLLPGFGTYCCLKHDNKS